MNDILDEQEQISRPRYWNKTKEFEPPSSANISDTNTDSYVRQIVKDVLNKNEEIGCNCKQRSNDRLSELAKRTQYYEETESGPKKIYDRRFIPKEPFKISKKKLYKTSSKLMKIIF